MSNRALYVPPKLAAVAGFALALVGSRLPWVKGIDSTWGAFGVREYWLELERLDIRWLDGWAVVGLAVVGAVVATVSIARRLDYWPIPLLIAIALVSLGVGEVDHVRDRREDVLIGLQLVCLGGALALFATLVDGILHMASRPALPPASDAPAKAGTRRLEVRTHAEASVDSRHEPSRPH